MSGSTFGKNFRITTWGESHGPALGVVVDGCPSNFELQTDKLQAYIDRRKPTSQIASTKRKESDILHILSGFYDGKTLGTPISVVFFNEDANSKDYSNLKDIYRPGHADVTYDLKYGIRDYRGGGRSSGRETIGRVVAGGIAVQILESLNISVKARIQSIGIHTNTYTSDKEFLSSISDFLLDIQNNQDSIGGCVECIISGVPGGIGEPVFDKLDALLSHAVFSIGGVKAVEIGSGTNCAAMTGSTHNDVILEKTSSGIHTATNHAGGLLGGISTGENIILRASLKPTPSIAKSQETIDKDGNPATLSIIGRHDTSIVPRAVVVVEAMCALTILDMLMEQNHNDILP